MSDFEIENQKSIADAMFLGAIRRAAAEQRTAIEAAIARGEACFMCGESFDRPWCKPDVYQPGNCAFCMREKRT